MKILCDSCKLKNICIDYVKNKGENLEVCKSYVENKSIFRNL